MSKAQMSKFLDGKLSFDVLTPMEQAVAGEFLFESLETFEPNAEFVAELQTGLGYSGLNTDGKLERRGP